MLTSINSAMPLSESRHASHRKCESVILWTGIMPATIKFTAATFAVPENFEAAYVIATLSVEGGKAEEVFTYTLTEDFGGRFVIRQDEETEDWQLVALNDEALSLFDFESAIKSFALNITAEGSGQTKVDDAAITISVTNVNEFAPTDITVTGGTIAENAPLDADVAILSAVDQDGSVPSPTALSTQTRTSRLKATRSS
jgi:serralysin